MLSDITPCKLAGNCYFVGTYKASSHMIDTGDGLILIDVGYSHSADVVIDSLSILGYDVKDVTMILLSHGHGDHSDGVPGIVALSGAKVYMFEQDNRYLKGFLPDVYLHDGDVIKLGNTEILCLHTPGHTEGTASYFFYTEENGKTLRVGTFGGAGHKQVMKPFLDKYGLTYLQRGMFYRSIERLRGEHVDVFMGNHSWHNKTREKSEMIAAGCEENPFIDETLWGKFLDATEANLDKVIADETVTEFVNYAHRGASEYCPENTMLSFYTGMYMRANGIETDVRRTKDGVLILFHDKNPERVCGEGLTREIADYTWAELLELNVANGGLTDKIVRFEDFLDHFAHRDITFAIELKAAGIEAEVADLIRKYDMVKKTVVTSFEIDFIRNIKAYAPELRIGLLTKEFKEEEIAELIAMRADEYCPRATWVTPEMVTRLHREGFRVRAWGVKTEELMQHVVVCGCDGMTVNFPDKLVAYLAERSK